MLKAGLRQPLRSSTKLHLASAQHPSVAGRRLVLAAADGPRVTREYREDDGSLTTPEAEAPGPLYADEVQKVRAPPKKDNLSKEMKARLRQEYMGLGGAENKAMSSNYFLWIIVVVSALAVASKLSGAI